MAVENYSLDDIKIILQAFNLPVRPYATRKDLTADIYFRQVTTLDGIDLWQDTFEYLQIVVVNGGQAASHRKVAFLFENSGRKFAVIACYQNLLSEDIKRAIEPKNGKQTAFSFYKSIHLECVAPSSVQGELSSELQHLSLPIKMHTLTENSGVTLTESILMLLFGDKISPMALEQIFNSQRRRCEQQLIAWLTDFQKTNLAKYQKVIELLAIVIKFTLLDSQQTALLSMPDREYFLRHNERQKKLFFSLPLGDIASILPRLPLTGIIHILRLRHEPTELIKQLEYQRRGQEQTILAREKYVMQLVKPLSWRSWATQSLVRVPEYCYARSHINLGANLVPWIMQQITPSRIEKPLENILQRILLLVTQVCNFVPQSIRHVEMRPLRHKNTVTAFNTCIGGGLGLLSMYYTGMFEVLFSLMLLFLTEFFYNFLAVKRIDVSSATVISRIPFVPSMATLLRLNMMFILILIALYTNNSDYLKRAGTAMGVSELVRQCFIKISRDLELTAEEQSYCEFILTQCGMQFGELIFSTYTNVQNAIAARDEGIAEVLRVGEQFDGYVELPNIWLRPWRWFTSYNSFDLFWRNQQGDYHTDCEVISDGLGRMKDVVCPIVTTQFVS